MRRLTFAAIIVFSAPTVLSGQDAALTSKSTGMEFVLIRSGSVLMSKYQPRCPNVNYPPPAGADPGGRGFGQRVTAEMHDRCVELVARDSLPGFTTKIDKPFYMGKYEVTQGEWRKVMGSNPSHFQGNRVNDDADRHPVENVTWEMAQQFIAKLNKMEHTKAYRLPTEFEWEYAARTGGDDDVPWNQLRDYAWYAQLGPARGAPGQRPAGVPGASGSPAVANSTGAAGATQPPATGPLSTALAPKPTTHPVGEKKPNSWGLYDMIGNVWEWVQDYYNNKWLADPTPPKSGTTHVLKGGSFNEDQIGASYFNHAGGPADGWDVGFRIVRDAE